MQGRKSIIIMKAGAWQRIGFFVFGLLWVTASAHGQGMPYTYSPSQPPSLHLVERAVPQMAIPQMMTINGQARTAHSPRRALRQALMVPGWGQIYNRQYLKLPFVYAALGGVAYLAFDLNRDYKQYREAYQYIAWENLVATEGNGIDANPRASFKSSYDELVAELGFEPLVSGLQQRRDNLRRNRDFSLIGIGLVYSLTVLDAYISAHLLDFDIGEDLTARVQPHTTGASFSLQFRF